MTYGDIRYYINRLDEILKEDQNSSDLSKEISYRIKNFIISIAEELENPYDEEDDEE